MTGKIYVPGTSEADLTKIIMSLQALNGGKADLDSPAFINIPTAPTAPLNTNTTQLATTAYVVNDRSIVSTRQFDVVDDGADQRSKVQAAYDSVPLYGTLLIHATTNGISVGPSGSGYSIRADRPVNIVGEKMAYIKPMSTIANTDDIFRVTPSVGDWSMFGMSRLFIGDLATGTRRGRDAIRIDTTVYANEIPSAFFHHIYAAAPAVGHTSGNAFNHVNTAALNANGGMYASTIEKCILLGGVNFTQSGDHNCLQRCDVGGVNGISVQLIAGAGNFGLIRNNIFQTGGTTFLSGLKPTITGNTFEQTVASTQANNALLDLSGSTSSIEGAKIYDNQLQVPSSLIGSPVPIRIATATNAFIDLNYISVAGTYSPIVLTAASSGTNIGGFNTILVGGGAAYVSDAGASLGHAEIQRIRPSNNSPLTISVDDHTIANGAGLSGGGPAYTLPAVSKCKPGQRIHIVDVAHGINGANVITVTCAGADIFQNGTATYAMNTAGQKVTCEAFPNFGIWFVTKSLF